MKNTEIIIAGVILIVGILVGFGYLWRFATAKEADIQKLSTSTPPVSKDILKSDIFTKLDEYNLNGPLPVVLNKDDFGREDPFANY